MYNNNDEDIVEVEYTEEDIKRKNRRVFKMITVSGLTLVVLIVATYAWFIGITTVKVNAFQVNVETFKGLQISFDASSWSDSVSITGDTTDDNAYNATNRSINNHWLDYKNPSDTTEGYKGLVPISSAGEFSTTGHLKLFSNASINAITGGYRIRTEKILNEASEQAQGFDGTTTSPEKGQYITFDLYLKNTTNTQGTLPNASAYTPDETEAVYLTTNSSVTLHAEEGKNDDDGLENSLRVGFYQVAYAPLGTTEAKLRTMNCTSVAADSIVGTCTTSGTTGNRGSAWNIWEPNDMTHADKAISNFNRLCRLRTGADTYTAPVADDLSTKCKADGTNLFANNQYVTTYGVRAAIGNSDKVNMYDGINTYMTTVGTDKFLNAVTTLRESQNVINTSDLYATDRSSLIKLEPNSITKIRVYVWLEGQDLDNLDYVGETQNLLINMGFTKDIYEEDVNATPSPTTTTEEP